MLTRRKRLVGCLAVPLAIILVFILSSPLWLRWSGQLLERSDPPQKADAALVLGGDAYGNRVLTAAELVKQGLVSKVLVSGPEGMYGYHESELAIQYAVKRGYPESYFEGLPNKSHSTVEEADLLIPELRRRNIHSLDLVTSDYHTRRAGRIFRARAKEMQIWAVAAPDSTFELHSWWKTREGRKTIFMEWAKTFAGWFGL